jgi:hypothetical protein
MMYRTSKERSTRATSAGLENGYTPYFTRAGLIVLRSNEAKYAPKAGPIVNAIANAIPTNACFENQ